jgi:hypothetical protein
MIHPRIADLGSDIRAVVAEIRTQDALVQQLVEFAVAKACQDIAEDGGAQGRRLALFLHGLSARAGKGAHELGVGTVEALAGDAVPEFDRCQRHSEGRPGGASVGALKQPGGDDSRGDGRRVRVSTISAALAVRAARDCVTPQGYLM